MVADVGLAVDAPERDIGRPGPDGSRLALADVDEKLVVLQVICPCLPGNHGRGGYAGVGQRPQARLSRGALDPGAGGRPVGGADVLPVLVHLQVEDQSHVDAPLDGSREFGKHWRVGEFVERAAQGVAGLGPPDHGEEGLVEVAAEPVQGELPGGGSGLLVRGQPAETALVRLRAGHSAIEDDGMPLTPQRLAAHRDLDRRAIPGFGRGAAERDEAVVVGSVLPHGEIVPDE